jgi:hypothetical protein
MFVPLDTIIGETYGGRHPADLQDQHWLLCKQYKNTASLAESETRYLAILAWWLFSGATTI